MMLALDWGLEKKDLSYWPEVKFLKNDLAQGGEEGLPLDLFE